MNNLKIINPKSVHTSILSEVTKGSFFYLWTTSGQTLLYKTTKSQKSKHLCVEFPSGDVRYLEDDAVIIPIAGVNLVVENVTPEKPTISVGDDNRQFSTLAISQEKIDLIRKLFLEDYTYQKISDMTQVSTATVIKYTHDLNEQYPRKTGPRPKN